ncbi:MAG: division/cell wall cluster transcriptional repressor MraZ [Candidatus Omnitrophota bacterium]
MFYGEYEHSLDKKGRIIIPSNFRDFLKEHYIEKLFVTRGLDKCLFMFTEEDWKTQESKFRSIPFTRSEARKFNRLYFSGATEVTCDKQGRILIPRYLKEYAGIKKELMIIGVSNRIEIWAKDTWKAYYEISEQSFEEIAEKLLEGGSNGIPA